MLQIVDRELHILWFKVTCALRSFLITYSFIFLFRSAQVFFLTAFSFQTLAMPKGKEINRTDLNLSFFFFRLLGATDGKESE